MPNGRQRDSVWWRDSLMARASLELKVVDGPLDRRLLGGADAELLRTTGRMR
jgi:hypothetical protein